MPKLVDLCEIKLDWFDKICLDQTLETEPR